jgi:hypothetical protein
MKGRSAYDGAFRLDSLPRWGEEESTRIAPAYRFRWPVLPLTPDPSPRWGEGDWKNAGRNLWILAGC